MEYHQWQQSCGETTARAYIEGIGKTYESHKHHFSHGEKILKYERGAVPAISVIFVSSWTAALHNNDVDGFIKGLKTRHEELYKLFEENTNWLNECQSLYDEQCTVRNKFIASQRPFIPYPYASDDQARKHGSRKRKSTAPGYPDKRYRHQRVRRSNDGQATEGAVEQRALPPACQGQGPDANSRPQPRSCHGGPTDPLREAFPTSGRSNRQIEASEPSIGSAGFDAHFGFPAASASESIQRDPTRCVTGQPDPLPLQYNIGHEQTQKAGYGEMSIANTSHLLPTQYPNQYGLSISSWNHLISNESVSWFE